MISGILLYNLVKQRLNDLIVSALERDINVIRQKINKTLGLLIGNLNQ